MIRGGLGRMQIRLKDITRLKVDSCGNPALQGGVGHGVVHPVCRMAPSGERDSCRGMGGGNASAQKCRPPDGLSRTVHPRPEGRGYHKYRLAG